MTLNQVPLGEEEKYFYCYDCSYTGARSEFKVTMQGEFPNHTCPKCNSNGTNCVIYLRECIECHYRLEWRGIHYCISCAQKLGIQVPPDPKSLKISVRWIDGDGKEHTEELHKSEGFMADMWEAMRNFKSPAEALAYLANYGGTHGRNNDLGWSINIGHSKILG
jgi:hypothetical protein